jgi:hypothetical protein
VGDHPQLQRRPYDDFKDDDMKGGRLIATGIALCIIFVALGGLSVAYFMGVHPRQAFAIFSRVESTQLWQSLEFFFNSAFVTAAIGSLAGAFAGAYGGYMIVERGKIREAMLKEIRNTNASNMVSFGICNSLLSTKQQIVKPLKEKYVSQRAEFLEYKRKRDTGEVGKDATFELQMDFQTFTLPPLAIDILQTQAFEKLSLVARPLLLVTSLRQALHSLEQALTTRNALIASYKANSPVSPNVLIPLYFGLPDGQGRANQDYRTSIEAIFSLTDSAIFFSCLLCKDLTEHGEHIAATFKKKFRSGAPSIARPEFAKAKAANLMPAAESFADWIGMFVKGADAQSVD